MNRYCIVHGELLLLALRFYEKENQMAVLKNKTQGQYTMVSQRIMKDKSLSLTERGMLLVIIQLIYLCMIVYLDGYFDSRNRTMGWQQIQNL